MEISEGALTAAQHHEAASKEFGASASRGGSDFQMGTFT